MVFVGAAVLSHSTIPFDGQGSLSPVKSCRVRYESFPKDLQVQFKSTFSTMKFSLGPQADYFELICVEAHSYRHIIFKLWTKNNKRFVMFHPLLFASRVRIA